MKNQIDQPAGNKKGRVNGHVLHRVTRKAKCNAYLIRSTCAACRAVFRSPKKRRDHVNSGHTIMVGHNTTRAIKGTYILNSLSVK